MGYDFTRSRDSESEAEDESSSRSVPGLRSQPASKRDPAATGPMTGTQAERRYGVEIESGKQLRALQRMEDAYGMRVAEWAQEGMPIEAMGTPSKMEAFRERKGTPMPWNVEEHNEQSVQRSAEAAADTSPAGDAGVPESVRDVISSPGQSLDVSIQRAMEQRMGDSFGDVRVHAGPTAARACEQIDARAFTVGNHVAFNSGEYDPSSPEGQHVLAHELAHVRQQTGSAVSMLPQEDVELETDPDPTLEREAEETAQRVMAGGELGIQRLGDTEVYVQRLSQEGKERLERLRDRLGLAQPTGDEVREAIEAIPVDLDELSDPEGVEQLFRTGSNQQISNAESLVVAEAVFEHIERVEAEMDPRFAGSLLPVAGRDRDDARLSLADGINVDTVHHELGHAVADAHGYNVGDRATFTNENRYDPSRNTFPDVPESEYAEHHLTQVEPGDVPPELERLIAEVNDAWERMQSAHTDGSENEHMYTFEAFSDIDNYSAVHAHETLAHLHEAMQFDELRHPANWFYRHGELLRAYVQVFDPCQTKRGLVSHLHREDPEASPFSSDPYPGSDPDRRAIEAWKKDVKTTLEKDDKFANSGQYYEGAHYE